MKKLDLIKVAFLVCFLFVCSTCENDQPSNAQLIIEEDIPVTDYDGNIYKTVRIGNQIWMAENLRTTHYSDGTPAISFIYNYEDTNVYKYGRLYYWTVAMRNHHSSNSNPSGVQGVSPDGWHIPSENEWLELINNLGGPSVAGGKLKSPDTEGLSYNNLTDSGESLFNALLGGFYRQDGQFLRLGEWGIFLTSTSCQTINYDGIRVIKLSNNSQGVQIEPFELNDAGAIRCVKN